MLTLKEKISQLVVKETNKCVGKTREQVAKKLGIPLDDIVYTYDSNYRINLAASMADSILEVVIESPESKNAETEG